MSIRQHPKFRNSGSGGAIETNAGAAALSFPRLGSVSHSLWDTMTAAHCTYPGDSPGKNEWDTLLQCKKVKSESAKSLSRVRLHSMD